MFKSKTVFVVGAGASKEVGLPMGTELKTRISNTLNFKVDYSGALNFGDQNVWDSIGRLSKLNNIPGEDRNFYRRHAVNISESMPLSISIDNYLDAHRGNKTIEICGKLAIAACILQAEKDSLITSERFQAHEETYWSNLQNTWYILFQQLLTENVAVDELHKLSENISFIIFNYDRCIEHFLSISLSKYYGITLQQAQEIVKKIVIFHPYGVIGALPWQSPNKGVPFGANANTVNLIEIAGNIKTFTERVEEGNELSAIRNELETANKIIFLGFSYGDQNIDLIKPQSKTSATRIIGTAFGISGYDVNAIRTTLSHSFGIGLGSDGSNSFSLIQLEQHLTCYAFFDAHRRSIPA